MAAPDDEKVRAAKARVTGDCGCDDLYYCGTSDDIECPRHGGFDVCCAHPESHLPVGPLSPS